MPTPLDLTLPSKIKAIIARFGVSGIITSHDGDAYDPSNRGTAGDTTNYSAIFTPLVPVSSSFSGDATRAEKTFETWVSAQALTYVPKVGDGINTSGVSATIVAVEIYKSGSSAVAYKLTGVV